MAYCDLNIISKQRNPGNGIEDINISDPRLSSTLLVWSHLKAGMMILTSHHHHPHYNPHVTTPEQRTTPSPKPNPSLPLHLTPTHRPSTLLLAPFHKIRHPPLNLRCEHEVKLSATPSHSIPPNPKKLAPGPRHLGRQRRRTRLCILRLMLRLVGRNYCDWMVGWRVLSHASGASRTSPRGGVCPQALYVNVLRKIP